MAEQQMILVLGSLMSLFCIARGCTVFCEPGKHHCVVECNQTGWCLGAGCEGSMGCHVECPPDSFSVQYFPLKPSIVFFVTSEQRKELYD